MTLVGGYQSKHFIKIIKKYIDDYVRCKDCRGLNTEIKKESRLTYLNCHKCKASRTVQAISSRYTATRRGERRAARN